MESVDWVVFQWLICIDSTLHVTGLEALGADLNLHDGAVSCVDFDALKVDVPASASMTVRVTDSITSYRPAPAAFTKFSHKKILRCV